MYLSTDLTRRWKAAEVVAQDISFPDMDFRAAWSSSNTATKQDGWARIHADEVSVWPEFTVDMVRRRTSAYPFHHIIFGGSIDPTRTGDPKQDPVYKLYLESSRGTWQMPEPGGNGQFCWQLGGIWWPDDKCKDDDGEYVLEAVRANARYRTPSGKWIDESDRMDITRQGHWEHAAPDSQRRGYKVVAAMVPFSDCSFGELAVRFLSAKHRLNLTGSVEARQKNTLRVYFAENWAEVHHDEKLETKDTRLKQCEANYKLGDAYTHEGWKSAIIFTVDVQKYHLWWLARTWSWAPDGKDCQSALINWGKSATFNDLDAVAADIKPDMVGIDISYQGRQTEVGAYCSMYTDQRNVEDSLVIALRGSSSLKTMPIDHHVRDAYEGGRSAGRALFFELTWAVDVYRTMLLDSINGEGHTWLVPAARDNERLWRTEYIKQVTSTKKLDGEWQDPGHRQNHLWDCETMQYVLAAFAGVI
jgi:hypothetical protein